MPTSIYSLIRLLHGTSISTKRRRDVGPVARTERLHRHLTGEGEVRVVETSHLGHTSPRPDSIDGERVQVTEIPNGEHRLGGKIKNFRSI